MADRSQARLLTVADPVRVASVSKLFVALGVMRLVEAGTLRLDTDVAEVLKRPVRNPAFPQIAITLRMLLSHTSSLRDDADYVIPLGGSIDATLADGKAWDAAHTPGRWFHYTNLNFPIIASVMEAATGERFDRLMARLVFVPLRLDACFNWTTCSDSAVSRAVVLYGSDGSVRRDNLERTRPACPVAVTSGCDFADWHAGTNGSLFSPQGGVRISALDLARVGQMIVRRGDGFLKPSSLAIMTRPVWRFDGGNGDTEGGFYCSYGLGVQTLATPRSGCADDLFDDRRPRVGHAGEAYGLRSGLWIDMQRRRGVAFYATGVSDDAPHGTSAFTKVEEQLAAGK